MPFNTDSDSALSRSSYAGSASSQLQRMESDSSLRWYEKAACVLTLALLCWIPGPLLILTGIGTMVDRGLDIQQLVVAMAGFIDLTFGSLGAWLLFGKRQ